MRRLLAVLLATTLAAAAVAAIDEVFAPAAAEPVGYFPTPTVPAQQQPPTPMICNGGQIDINIAPVDDLEDGLDLPRPVAERVVEQRPYLQAEELLAVAGIGPGHLERLLAAGSACATPPTDPPPAPNPCARSQVDVNAPDALDGLAAMVGRPVAERIIAGQPHYALHNLVRIPGIGPGKLKQHADKLCATPPPIDTAGPTSTGTRFAWVYSDDGGRNDLAGFGLTVPTAVVDDPVGAWTEITVLPTPANLPGTDYPTADFHIHSPWSDVDEVVYATVPDASFSDIFDGTWRRTLLHWDGDTRTTGEVVHSDRIVVDADTGSITGAVTSLSPIDWAMHKANWLVEPAYGILFGIRFPGPGCPNEPWDEIPGTPTWTRLGHHLRLSGERLDLPGNEVPYGGFPIKHCVQTAHVNGDTHAQAITRNATGAFMRMSDLGGDVTIGTDGEVSSNIVQEALKAVRSNGDVLLGPGDDGTATVPPGTAGTTDLRGDMGRSVMNVLGESLLDGAMKRLGGDPNLGQTVNQWLIDQFECAYDLVSAGTSNPGINIVRQVGVAIADCFGADDYLDFYVKISSRLDELVEGGTITRTQYRTYQNSLLELREASKILEIGGMVLGAAESLSWESSSPITIEHFAPAPGTDPDGNIYGPGCVRRAGFSWVVDDACQQAFLRSLAGETNRCDSSGLQCTWGDNTNGGGTSTSCNPFAGSGGLQPAAPGCILWTGGFTWCGFGQCLPWPASALHVVELTDGRSMFIDANGGAWHLPTTDAYWSCTGRFGLYRNSTQYHPSGKWYPQNLVSYRFMGDLLGC